MSSDIMLLCGIGGGSGTFLSPSPGLDPHYISKLSIATYNTLSQRLQMSKWHMSPWIKVVFSMDGGGWWGDRLWCVVQLGVECLTPSPSLDPFTYS